MSDPLSIAGSAVGIISLGLSLCGEIVRYARNVQGQSDDIEYLATKASNIRTLMKHLREFIEETNDDLPDVATDLESKAFGLQTYLNRLEGPIGKFKQAQVATESLRSRAQSTWIKAKYHFKKEDLFEVRDCLQSMEMDLNSALNLYTARGLHQFGLRQNTFRLKQDLLIEKMDTLQLSLTASSHQLILQEPTHDSVSRHGNLSLQSCRPLVTYNWNNVRAQQGRKQYKLYSRWLSRTFTATFCLSANPGIFPIVSLHCHAVVGPESWLGRMYREQRYFSPERHEGKGKIGWELSSIDKWIQMFQLAFSEGELRPTDELLSPYNELFGGEHLTLIDVRFPIMLDHHVTSNYRDPFSAFRTLCESPIWTEDVHHLAYYIIEKCGPINWIPVSWTAKRNMQSLLARHEDAIDLPSAYIEILRESERDLHDLLESKAWLFEEDIDRDSLLQLTMGWPDGIKLLLTFLEMKPGIHLPENFHQVFFHGFTDEDKKIDEYVDSCIILLDAGFKISQWDIVNSTSQRLRRLFIHEIAKRRKMHLDIAEAHINPRELSELRKGETGIPDSSAPTLCAAITAKGHYIDQELIALERESLFSFNISAQGLEEIYEAGYMDVDLLLEGGYTPLMVRCDAYDYIHGHSEYQAIGWMISKGANPFRKIPRSNTTTLHLISRRFGRSIFYGYKAPGNYDPYVGLRHLQQIDFYLFSLSRRDECSCSCSCYGCTPLSIAIRDIVDRLYLGGREIGQVACEFRRFLEFVINHNQSTLEGCHAIIRVLTFDGLSLCHTCCTEIQDYGLRADARDEFELEEIREEQKIPLRMFEKLLSEFSVQFDALDLPLMNFLQEIWYERMVKYLSERDKCDSEHNEKARELGINLEMDEIEIPLVVQLMCDQVRVIESD